MIEVRNKLDYTKSWYLPDIYLFTGNPARNKFGAVVMGAGAAKSVRDTYPGVDRKIKTNKPVTFTEITSGQFIGWFKVKNHWAENARQDLITESAKYLKEIALKRTEVKFHINYPGIGNGGLRYKEVSSILNELELPDNIIFYV